MSAEDGKRSPGEKIHKVPATVWNNAMDAGQAWAAQQLSTNTPLAAAMRVTDIVKVRNDTGQDMARGEVLCLDDFVLDDLIFDSLWFSGLVPDSSEAPPTSKPYGVLLDPIKHQSSGPQHFGRLAVSGVCLAKIDNLDNEHQYAHIVSGEKQLATNSSRGQAQILYRQNVGGQWWAAIRLSNYRGGGACDFIRFKIITTGTNALGIRWAEVNVLSRPCGCDEVSEEVAAVIARIYDMAGCYLNEPDIDLVDRVGFAKYMQDVRFVSSPIEPGGPVPDCGWEIHALCCPTCDPPETSTSSPSSGDSPSAMITGDGPGPIPGQFLE